MFCPNCGVESLDSNNYCRRCGTNLKGDKVAVSKVEGNEIYIRLHITNQKTSQENIFESPKRDVLVGSGSECDLILEGEEVMRQHCRLVQASNHLFLQLNQANKTGIILPVYREEFSEQRTNYHWTGDERRIDNQPFQIGQYTIHQV